MIQIDIDSVAVQRALANAELELKNSRSLMRRIAFDMRDYIRETFARNGRSRPWAPLSPWTAARTGRRQPLRPLIPGLRAQYDDRSAIVYFYSAKAERQGWSILQHHEGYNIPARRMLQAIPQRRGMVVFTQKAKAAKVPARPIIPTQAEQNIVIGAAIQQWLRTWR